MQPTRIAAAALLLVLSSAAPAQSILWSHRVFGAPNPGSATPFFAYAPSTAIPDTRPFMAWSAAGTPGLATVGRHASGSLVAKLSPADGSESWRRELNLGPGFGPSASSVAVDAEGNIVVGGSHFASGVSQPWYVAKIAGADGQVAWQRQIPVPNAAGGQIVALATTASDDIVAVGTRSAETNPQSFVMRLSGTTGLAAWTTSIPHYIAFERAAIAVDAADNVFVSPNSAALVKLAPDGTVSWTANLASTPGLSACLIRALRIDPTTSDAIVAGRANCTDGSATAFAARIRNGDGAVVWSVADLGGAATSDATALAAPGNGAVFVAGGRAAAAQLPAWFATRLSVADGDAAWTASVASQTQYTATDIAIGPDGEALLSGVCNGNTFCAARLDGATGTRDWITQTGTPYAPSDENYPNTILATGGGVFFGGKDTSVGATTWTVHRVDNAIADAIFENGFE